MDLPAPPLPPPPLLPPADAMCFCRTALPGLLAAPAAAEASARRDDGRDESSPLLGRRAARSLRIRLLSVDGGVGASRQRPGPVGLSMPGTGAGAARFIPFHWSIMMACITHRSLARSLALGVRSSRHATTTSHDQQGHRDGRPQARGPNPIWIDRTLRGGRHGDGNRNTARPGQAAPRPPFAQTGTASEEKARSRRPLAEV